VGRFNCTGIENRLGECQYQKMNNDLGCAEKIADKYSWPTAGVQDKLFSLLRPANLYITITFKFIDWCLTPTLAVFQLYRGIILKLNLR
jgi:hypothetical protein